MTSWRKTDDNKTIINFTSKMGVVTGRWIRILYSIHFVANVVHTHTRTHTHRLVHYLIQVLQRIKIVGVDNTTDACLVYWQWSWCNHRKLHKRAQ